MSSKKKLLPILISLTLLPIVFILADQPQTEYIWLSPGGSGQVELEIRGVENFTGEVVLSAEAPDFISCNFSTQTVWLAPGIGASVNLTFSVAIDAPLGEYEVIVLARSGEIFSQTTVQVAIGELNVSISQLDTQSKVGKPATLIVKVLPIGPPPNYASLSIESRCADVTPSQAEGIPPFEVELSAISDTVGNCTINANAYVGGAAWSANIIIEFLSPITYELVEASLPSSLRLGENLSFKGMVFPAPNETASLKVILRTPAGDERISIHEDSVDPTGNFEFIENLDLSGEWQVGILLIDPLTGAEVKLGSFSIDVIKLLPDLTIALDPIPSTVELGENMRISLRVVDSSGSLDGPVNVSLYDDTSRELIFSDFVLVKGGSSEKIVVEYKPSLTGTRVVSVMVDPENEIEESNEDNNQAYLELVIAEPGQKEGLNTRYIIVLVFLTAGVLATVLMFRARIGPFAPSPTSVDPCKGIRDKLSRIEERLKRELEAVPRGLRDEPDTNKVKKRLQRDHEARRKRISEEIKRTRDEKEALNEKVKSLREKMGSLKEQGKELKEKAEKTNADLKKVDRRLQRLDSLQKERERAQKAVKNAEEELKEAQEKARERLERYSETLRNRFKHRTLKRLVREREERLRRAEERLKENPNSEYRKTVVKRAMARLSHAKRRLEEEERWIEEKVQEREKRVLEGGSVKRMSRVLGTRKRVLEAANKRLKAYEKKHSTQIAKREDLRKELGSYRSKINEINRKLSEAREELERKISDLNEKEKKLAELKRKLKAMDAEKERIEEIISAHKELNRLKRERIGLNRMIRECEEKNKEELVKFRLKMLKMKQECEKKRNELLKERRELINTLNRRKEDALRGVDLRLGELGSVEESIKELPNAFEEFMKELRNVIDILKLAGAKIDPTKFNGLWSWGDNVLGVLGTATGYMLEDVASVPLPTDLIKAVGGIYSIMSYILDPTKAGGEDLLIGTEKNCWKDLVWAFKKWRDLLVGAQKDPLLLKDAKSYVDLARAKLREVRNRIGNLKIPSISFQFSDDCETDLQLLKKELKKLKCLEEELNDCKVDLRTVEKARFRALGIKTRVSSLERGANGLRLYGSAMRNKFKL